jgi:hypothetical protein
MMKNKGITLLALVITIIVLLILAGVTIASITGNSGVLEQAKRASETSRTAKEIEAIRMNIDSVQIDNYNDNNDKEYLGKALYDKTVANSDKWDILINNETNEKYGTNWRYLVKGEEIPGYGKASKNYLINYTNGEVKEAGDNYSEISFKDSIGITDGLVFNLDATNMDKDLSNWGRNVTLRYYDKEKYSTPELCKSAYEEQKKYESVDKNDTGYDRQISKDSTKYIDQDNRAFKFDGTNYIEVKNEVGFDFSKGLTIEYYGQINYKTNWAIPYEGAVPSIPFLYIWHGKYAGSWGLARTAYTYTGKILWNSLNPGEYENKNHTNIQYGSFDEKDNSNYNQEYNVNLEDGKDAYVTLTFNADNDGNVIQTYYLNGKKQGEGWLLKRYYNDFATLAKQMKYIELGRLPVDGPFRWSYMIGNAYCYRIYNRGLSDEEVKQNVEKTELYRKAIIK